MMFLLKKYINLLLLVVLCTLSTEAMAQHTKRAKQQKSTHKTELVESARKEKKSKKIEKAAKPSKAKEDKKISKEKKPKRSGVKRRAEALKSARKDAKNSKRRTVKQNEMEVIVSVVQPAAASTPAHKVSAAEPTTQISHSVVIEQKTLTRAEKIKERGITNMDNIFVAKGSWIGGVSASYSHHTNDNYSFAIIDGIMSEGYTLRASAMGAYALRNNMAIGIRGTYNRSNLTVNSANLKFGDDETGTEISINQYKVVRHSYSAAAIWRQYIPLGRSKRFAIFNEMSLGAGASQAIFAADQPVKGTYEEGYTISLGVSPGLMAFATNDIAIEVNVGVMGINFSDVKQVHNQIYDGKRRSSSMNFNVNLLSIGVGVSFYL